MIARMKIHLFLLGLGVALFVGCGGQAMPVPEEQLPDETIIDFSIREAMGEGDLFGRHRFGFAEGDFAETEENSADSPDSNVKGAGKSPPIARPVDPVARLTQLTIWNRGLGNVSGLLRLKAVKSLYLVDNEIRDVRPLAQLANLEELYLDGNPVGDVSALAGCKKLKVLLLRGTPAAKTFGVARLRTALPNCEIILE